MGMVMVEKLGWGFFEGRKKRKMERRYGKNGMEVK